MESWAVCEIKVQAPINYECIAYGVVALWLPPKLLQSRASQDVWDWEGMDLLQILLPPPPVWINLVFPENFQTKYWQL